jgi:pimeloyl-ACP methyl ester carboxylesterase
MERFAPLTAPGSSIAINDCRISTAQGGLFAREWRPAPGRPAPPIVMLHDSLGCVDVWRDLPAMLSARTGRRVIAYDRLGFGRSDPESGFRRPSSHPLPPIDLLSRVWHLRDSLTAYDAVYVALAEALETPLLTTDRKVARAHGHGATVELLSCGTDIGLAVQGASTCQVPDQASRGSPGPSRWYASAQTARATQQNISITARESLRGN